MIVEVTGRIFHMHIQAETEDGPNDLVADVAIEPSMGLLMIAAGGIACSGSWPERDQWGTKTFEEFLCSRTPSWIVSKMLGQNAMMFDPDRTREALLDTCSDDMVDQINHLINHTDAHGDVGPGADIAMQEITEDIEEPCDGYIFMQTTGLADFLIEGVLPALLERICPPPVVTDQTNLKLC